MDALLAFIKSHREIYLYGAGANGVLLADTLLNKGIVISGFVVTRRNLGHERLLGLPIFEVNELDNFNDSCCGFIFALGSNFHYEVAKTLEKYGIKEIFRLSDVFFQELRRNVLKMSVPEILSSWPEPKKDCLSPISWRRILVLRLDGIGDVVLSTPFLRALRHAHPESEITLIVQPMVYNLMEACPYINHLLTYEWREDNEWPLRVRCRHALEYVKEQGLSDNYDVVLNPRWGEDYYDAGALAYFTGASCRVAWSENVLPSKKKVNLGFDNFYTMTILDKRVCHEVEHNMQFLMQLGITVDK